MYSLKPIPVPFLPPLQLYSLHTAFRSGVQQSRFAKAQAHFFRAWSYLNLGECFGGVFLVTDICTEPRFNFARSTRVETYKFAIDELEGCLDDFPESHPERGRIVKGAAQHTLAQL